MAISKEEAQKNFAQLLNKVLDDKGVSKGRGRAREFYDRFVNLPHMPTKSYESARKWIKGEAVPARQDLVSLSMELGCDASAIDPYHRDTQSIIERFHSSMNYLRGMVAERVNLAIVPFYDPNPVELEDQDEDIRTAEFGTAFRKSWLRNEGLEQENLVCVEVTSDEMAPTLTKGAILLVDTSKNAPTGNVFLLKVGSTTIIRRLQPLATGDLVLKADNQSYSEEAISKKDRENITVVGQVLWSGNKI